VHHRGQDLSDLGLAERAGASVSISGGQCYDH
jgi:hypothetical protein